MIFHRLSHWIEWIVSDRWAVTTDSRSIEVTCGRCDWHRRRQFDGGVCDQ